MGNLSLVPKLLAVSILMLLSMKIYGQSFVQNYRDMIITIHGGNMTVKEVFDSITTQTGLYFIYTNDDVMETRRINSSFMEISVDKTLAYLFPDGAYTRIYVANTVRIVKNKGNTLQRTDSTRYIPASGMVVNAEGKPIEGATISLEGKKSTITDQYGIFHLNGVMIHEKIRISFIGYESKELPIKEIRNKKITLSEKITRLKGLSVTSNGYQKLTDNKTIGSTTRTDDKQFNRTLSTNILDRMFNITAGLNYMPANAAIPGKSPFPIRGTSTILGNQFPLIVIDNFPYNEIATESSILNYLSPNDVDSISVLKDAAAASIWGARAGNGVIVITTKKGKLNQKTRIQLNASVTIGERPDLYSLPQTSSEATVALQQELFKRGAYNDHDDTYPYMEMYRSLPEVVELLLAARRGDISPEYAREKISAYAKHDVRNDVNKYFLQNSIIRQYGLNISGGSTWMSYFSSISYHKDISSSRGDENERFTLRFDNSVHPFRNLNINIYGAFTQSGTLRNAMPIGGWMPYSMLADANGNHLPTPNKYRTTYVDTIRHPALLDWHYRPLDEQAFRNDVSKESDLRFGGALNYTIIKGLNLDIKSQFQQSRGRTRTLNDVNTFFTRDLINTYMFTSTFTGLDSFPIPLDDVLDKIAVAERTVNFRAQLNYEKKWGENHELIASAGAEFSESNFDRNSERQYGYNNYLIDYEKTYRLRGNQKMTNQIPGVPISAVSINNRMRGYYAISNYVYKEKYIAAFSIRQDGANLFGVKPNNQIVPLWSAGAGWYISNEKFYGSPWLALLKLRLSYGYTGNIKSDITSYAVIDFSEEPQDLSGIRSAWIVTPPNPYLKWEKTGTLNIGIDFESSNKRVEGSLEYYSRKVKDLISPVSVEATSGFSQYLGNHARMKGNGIDLILNTLNVKNPFLWKTNLAFSYNTDKVTGYSQAPTVANLLFGTSAYIGKPLNAIYSYKWGGLDSLTGAPRGYVEGRKVPYNVAMNGSNTKPEDLVYHGPSTPRFYGNILNTFKWKQFSLSCNIVYKFDYYFRRKTLSYTSLLMNGYGHSDYNYRWKEPGDELITNIPSIPVIFNPARDNFTQRSEIQVEKADHIRLQDIRIEYAIPINQISKVLAQSTATLYFVANNMGIIWRANKHNIDPSLAEDSYQVPRNYTVGASISF